MLSTIFCRRIIQTKVHEPEPTKYSSGQDYDALKQAVSDIDDKKFRILEFRNAGQTDTELKNKIQNLFTNAKKSMERCLP